MKLALAVLSCLILGIPVTTASATAAGSTTAAGAAAAAAPVSRHRVTWAGWDGVNFGTPFDEARRRAGGTLQPGTGDPSCGDVLTSGHARLDSFGYGQAHGVGDIAVGRPARYPLGLTAGMGPARAVGLAAHGPYPLHVRSYDHDHDGRYEQVAWVVGPRHHTLWFEYGDGARHLRVIGLAASKHVARVELDLAAGRLTPCP